MKSFVLGPALLVSALLVTGCGSLTLGDKFQVQVDPATQTARLTVEMSDGLQINMLNGEFPIANGQGKLIFVPATREENARIGVEVNLVALAGGQFTNIGAVSTLPNGAPLPVAITPPLLSIPVIKNNNFDVDALLSITPEVQIGAAVGISQINSRYVPGGISVCQNFRNEQGLAFAAICLYGPNGNESGGIFVGANLGDILNLDQQQPMAMTAARSAFAMSAETESFSRLSLNPVDMTSSNWAHSIHDPSKVLNRTWQKAERNVRRILRAQ